MLEIDIEKLDNYQKEKLKNFVKQNYDLISEILNFSYLNGMKLKSKNYLNLDDVNLAINLLQVCDVDRFKERLEVKCRQYIIFMEGVNYLVKSIVSDNEIYDFNDKFLDLISSNLLNKGGLKNDKRTN